ncbi:MAG: DUF2760 domain-containing protein [Desulfobacterales bacterium]|nr:DUF2760 domain-containing protein [Desulfobacterales bacterium]
MMNKITVATLLIVMLTISALAGGAFFCAKSYVDPTLKGLDSVVASMEGEAQEQVLAHLQALQRLRDMGSLYVPSVLFLAGLTATLIVSVSLRRLIGALIGAQVPERADVEILAEEEGLSETASDELVDTGACRLLSALQNKGRLVDFLQEDIAGYPDAQIGAAVRHIHEDCRNALSEYVTLAPVMSEKEGRTAVVSEGFDPSEIRLTGQITGSPPFEGVVQHSGWKVVRVKLPDQPRGQKHTVIAPAEVEIGEVE